eukprot:TRINITY_DN9089_c0_g1_i1.p1 TRINITY_DN9089_c0_g1~~TRINITY_DN9089_c0_g1_i1.p1  ORF type:complete len:619 (-),score=84.15 TRINITY_DN9089_c0_g1_i1:22-1878(-)
MKMLENQTSVKRCKTSTTGSKSPEMILPSCINSSRSPTKHFSNCYFESMWMNENVGESDLRQAMQDIDNWIEKSRDDPPILHQFFAESDQTLQQLLLRVQKALDGITVQQASELLPSAGKLLSRLFQMTPVLISPACLPLVRCVIEYLHSALQSPGRETDRITTWVSQQLESALDDPMGSEGMGMDVMMSELGFDVNTCCEATQKQAMNSLVNLLRSLNEDVVRDQHPWLPPEQSFLVPGRGDMHLHEPNLRSISLVLSQIYNASQVSEILQSLIVCEERISRDYPQSKLHQAFLEKVQDQDEGVLNVAAHHTTIQCILWNSHRDLYRSKIWHILGQMGSEPSNDAIRNHFGPLVEASITEPLLLIHLNQTLQSALVHTNSAALARVLSLVNSIILSKVPPSFSVHELYGKEVGPLVNILVHKPHLGLLKELNLTCTSMSQNTSLSRDDLHLQIFFLFSQFPGWVDAAIPAVAAHPSKTTKEALERILSILIEFLGWSHCHPFLPRTQSLQDKQAWLRRYIYALRAAIFQDENIQLFLEEYARDIWAWQPLSFGLLATFLKLEYGASKVVVPLLQFLKNSQSEGYRIPHSYFKQILKSAKTTEAVNFSRELAAMKSSP